MGRKCGKVGELQPLENATPEVGHYEMEAKRKKYFLRQPQVLLHSYSIFPFLAFQKNIVVNLTSRA